MLENIRTKAIPRHWFLNVGSYAKPMHTLFRRVNANCTIAKRKDNYINFLRLWEKENR